MDNREAMHEGRDEFDMDIDRMVNEGLGAGMVSSQNGLIEETTTNTMANGDTPNEAARQLEND